jgi:hypothetical protein
MIFSSLGLKLSLPTTIFALVLFSNVDIAYGQTESAFANCIMIIDKSLQVLLSTDEDCSEQQFSEAVTYYKANGFPHEGSYSNMFGIKTTQLLTDYGESLESKFSK